jgi:TRAP-type C4-dicarboxylate transport system substrate-binding protein
VATASFKSNNPDPYVIKFGTLAPEGTPWLAVPEKVLVPRIEDLANSTLKLKFYTGGIMGEDPDVLRKMDIGQLDGCGCTAFGVLEASPEASVFMVPNLFRNYQEVDYVYKKLRKLLDQSFAKKGYTCSAIIDTGFEYMFLKNKISGLDDLKKQKVLASMGHIESTLLEELGIGSIPVAIPELVSALSTGMGDAFISPAAWALGMQAYQYVNFYISTPFFYAPGVVLTSMSMKSRIGKCFGVSETLVDNVIELIILEISLVETEWKAQARNYEEKSLKAFETKCGIKPITLSPKDQKAFEEAALRVQEKLAGKDYPRDLLNEVLKALEEYRKTNGGGNKE